MRKNNLLSILSLAIVFITTGCDGISQSDDALFNERKLLRLVNEARSKGRYCGSTFYPKADPLKWNDQLEEAAKIQANDMYEKGFLSHKGSNGLYVDDRLYTVHYFWVACGENVAYGALYEDEVMEEWMKSPGHCANIMKSEYTEMGAWQSGLYWAQVFATPQKNYPL